MIVTRQVQIPWVSVRPGRCLIIVLIAMLGTTVLPVAATVHGQRDACPEPNDSFQQACFIGTQSDAFGFLQSADDVDAYRIEVLDFNARLRVALADMPAPYRVVVADWNGDPIAVSDDRSAQPVAEAVVPLPGTYYAFVQSAYGLVAPGAPYRASVSIEYRIRAPQVVASSDFGNPGGVIDCDRSDRSDVTFSRGGGSYSLEVRSSTQRSHFCYDGPRLRDVVFTVDSRIESGANGGYIIVPRTYESSKYMYIFVDHTDSTLAVYKVDGGKEENILGHWTRVESLNVDGGVNRTVVRLVSDQLIININGTEVLRTTVQIWPSGQIGVGTWTYGGNVSTRFDNLLVTAPVPPR